MENSGEFKRNQVDRYVANQMDEQERKNFEQRMRDHVELAENVHMHRDVLEGIDFFFAQELKQTLIQSDQQQPRNRWKTYLAVAASVLLLAGAAAAYYFWAMPQGYNQLFSAHFEPYPNLIAPTTRSTATSGEAAAMQDYEAGRYTEAIAGFEQLLRAEPANPSLLFYRGVAYLATGQTSQAITDLQAVIEVQDTAFTHPAYFYLGLGYLQMGRPAEAKSALQQLTEEQGVLSPQARELLQRIE